MLFLCFHVFQDFKSFCLGMKSRNKMRTKIVLEWYSWTKKFFFLEYHSWTKKSRPLHSPALLCNGMWQNFCSRNDSCNNEIWNLGTHENKGITFLEQKFFLRNTIPGTNGGSDTQIHRFLFHSCPDIHDLTHKSVVHYNLPNNFDRDMTTLTWDLITLTLTLILTSNVILTLWSWPWITW